MPIGVRGHLAIFVKEPRLGAVKSRLGAELGTVEALRFYRLTVETVGRRLARDRRWNTYFAVTPDTYRIAGRPTIPQGRGDLGSRMARVFDQFPPGPAVIVGSDIPELEAHHVARAFRKLGSVDAVFGPSEDGGYWLLGLNRRRRAPDLFHGVRWSSGSELADTLANLGGRSHALLDPLDDIDTIDDWKRWRARARPNALAGGA